MAVSVSNVDLMERVCRLTNEIYRKILCVESCGRVTYIALSGVSGLDHFQVSAFSLNTQYRIVLSWDLLAWISLEGRIPCSFKNFITTLELSGPLYIDPDIYHTLITEFSLQTLYQ